MLSQSKCTHQVLGGLDHGQIHPEQSAPAQSQGWAGRQSGKSVSASSWRDRPRRSWASRRAADKFLLKYSRSVYVVGTQTDSFAPIAPGGMYSISLKSSSTIDWLTTTASGPSISVSLTSQWFPCVCGVWKFLLALGMRSCILAELGRSRPGVCSWDAPRESFEILEPLGRGVCRSPTRLRKGVLSPSGRASRMLVDLPSTLSFNVRCGSGACSVHAEKGLRRTHGVS